MEEPTREERKAYRDAQVEKLLAQKPKRKRKSGSKKVGVKVKPKKAKPKAVAPVAVKVPDDAPPLWTPELAATETETKEK